MSKHFRPSNALRIGECFNFFIFRLLLPEKCIMFAFEMSDYPKNIYSFDGLYQVRPSGTIEPAPSRTPPLPEFYDTRDGQPAVLLHRLNTRNKYLKVRFLVKDVVAKAFLPNPDPLHFKRVRVKDHNEHNTSLDNLEWVDSREYAREQRARATRPAPSGWKGNSRTLPDGSTFKRRALAYPVKMFKAAPIRDTVEAGKLIRIFPSATDAARATGCSQSGIRHCCEYWHLFDGFGTTEVVIKGYGTCVNPDDLPAKQRVACSPTKQYVFKWVGFRDRRLHPVAVVLDPATDQVWWFDSVAKAAASLRHAYDTQAQAQSAFSSVAARSPMYDDPSALELLTSWPTAITRHGRANVFYV